MSVLLNNDHNAINYSDFFQNRIKLSVPKGRLGIELEKIDDRYQIVKVHENSKIKKRLNVGDIIIKLNDVELNDKDVDEVRMLFLKQTSSKRVLTIYR